METTIIFGNTPRNGSWEAQIAGRLEETSAMPVPLETVLHGGLRLHAPVERPQLYRKNGRPAVLFCAADEDRNHSFNVHIPLR